MKEYLWGFFLGNVFMFFIWFFVLLFTPNKKNIEREHESFCSCSECYEKKKGAGK